MSVNGGSFADLWTDYLEGSINDEGILNLCSLLTSDPDCVREAVDQYQVHRMLSVHFGTAAKPDTAFVESVLLRLPATSEALCSSVMANLNLGASLNLSDNAGGDTTVKPTLSQDRVNVRSGVFSRRSFSLLATAGVLLVGFLLTRTRTLSPVAENVALIDSSGPAFDEQLTFASVAQNVHISSLSQAVFEGEVVPSIGTSPIVDQKYVLLAGLVGLEFPNGASAIIESPAAFRIRSEKRIDLELGRCSVHAPDAGIGFEVFTPDARVLDRGTRFVVDVTDSKDTRVQVVEGAADVYRHSFSGDLDKKQEFPISGVTSGGGDIERVLRVDEGELFASLREGNACSIRSNPALSVERAEFVPTLYRDRLPDRLLAYNATRDSEGRVEFLASLTVQRGGKTYFYNVEDIIRVDLLSFKAYSEVERNGHLIGRGDPKALVQTALSDDSLVSGVINFGGATQPLTRSPVLQGNEESGPATPGMAVRFRRPVVNDPGPDIVVFELQTFREALKGGDAFHIGPLMFQSELRAHTVVDYDLILDSSADVLSSPFIMYRFEQPIEAIDDFETADFTSIRMSNAFAIVAVGVDLSDLGYRIGDKVDGLFIQDVDNSSAENRIDPVFIGGLPQVGE